MKQLGQAESNPFGAELIGQLSFIRRHRRYPFNRRTALPLAAIAGIGPGLFVLGLIMFLNPPNNPKSVQLVPVLFLCMCIPALASAFRYYQSIRFGTIRSGLDLGGNMLLLERYLKASRFAYSRHPDAPEVFSIVSTPIKAMDGEREVVIFIADAGRILINSHFTQNRFRAFIGKVRYPELARNLRSWLQQQQRVESTELTPLR